MNAVVGMRMVFHLRRANDQLHENMFYVKDSIDFIYSVKPRQARFLETTLPLHIS